MKRSLLLSLMIALCCSLAMAQAPAAMTFQSVVRTAQGELAASRMVTVQVSILQGSASGATVYEETFSGKTNANGLLTLKLGAGAPTVGSFAQIDWSDGPYFLQVAVDPEGGMNYLTQSTTQLLSVPYALYADKAEELAHPLSYNDLTDVPETSSFSGEYADLSGKPELAVVATSGSYADLEGKPTLATVATSGNYADLGGKPELATVATSGNYADLGGKPELATVATTGAYADIQGTPTYARVATTGSYNDLLDRPTISADGTFSGDYADLSGKPNLKDTVTTYGFSGNYEDLRNTPVLANVAFSGSYADLTDKPTISSDGFSGAYADLSGKPSIKDTVLLYGFSGSYNDLTDKPVISADGTFSGDYADLSGKPELATVATTGAYADLSGKPSIKDSVLAYAGNSAKVGKIDYDSITGKPAGEEEGDMLYWQDNQWKVLPIGEEGQFLAIANGVPSWIDPTWANVTANTYQVGDIYYNADGIAEGVIFELSTTGRYAKMLSVRSYPDIQWDPTAVTGSWNYATTVAPYEAGTSSIKDGAGNTKTIKQKSGWITAYPAVATCANLGDDWYLPAEKEVQTIASNRASINTQLANIGGDSLSENAYWSSTESGRCFALAVALKDHTITIEDTISTNIFSGDAIEALKSATYPVRPVRKLSWAEATSKKDVTVHHAGDLYIENGDTLGVVYATTLGGLHGKVLSLTTEILPWSEDSVLLNIAQESTGVQNQATVEAAVAAAHQSLSKYPAFYFANQLGDGWVIPSVDEWSEIQLAVVQINAAISNNCPGASPLDTTKHVWTSTEASKTNAFVMSLVDGNTASAKKSEKYAVRAIYEF